MLAGRRARNTETEGARPQAPAMFGAACELGGMGLREGGGSEPEQVHLEDFKFADLKWAKSSRMSKRWLVFTCRVQARAWVLHLPGQGSDSRFVSVSAPSSSFSSPGRMLQRWLTCGRSRVLDGRGMGQALNHGLTFRPGSGGQSRAACMSAGWV